MLTNQAVFYTSKLDLINVLCIFIIPIIITVTAVIVVYIFNLVNNSVAMKIALCTVAISLLLSFFWFGIKTAKENNITNGELPIYQSFSILFTKIVIALIFALALIFFMIDPAKDSKKNIRRPRRKSTVVFSLIFFWFYKKSLNIKIVMEKRNKK